MFTLLVAHRGVFLYKDEVFILQVTQGGLDKYPIPCNNFAEVI